MPSKSMIDACIKPFLEKNKLPPSYWDNAQKWFIPILEAIVSHQEQAQRPVLIGVNGAQGSGKSTFTELATVYLTNVMDLPCIGFSIDDFYFSKVKRQQLGQDIHPLLNTRGVPGTHDIALLERTIYQLMNGEKCTIPQFDKAIDDVKPSAEWLVSDIAPKVIILEGWCVGSVACDAENLTAPINQLEEENDANGRWRNYVNQQLLTTYHPVFALIDKLIMLKAPSFECVYKWRVEQEHKMLQRLKEDNQTIEGLGMTDEQIANFISFYQRITEDNLTLMPAFCDYLFDLDSNRNIVSCQHN